ncbi:glycogen/starch/alpha-glucan phosphorylase [Merdimmobilis hominis]|uniref:glycogen/starch/alpha-glucan phosphorylase n=1 Tax=Merdimmobilis hominis TaxID=2897707 RepID=UPI002803EFAC|nr:glycogen/starch/alpha-glucan phosphorylase [uncultured Merdimmobilis sp.]
MANSAYDMSADRASRLIRRYLEEDLQVEPDRASDQQFYKATAMAAKQLLAEKYRRFSAQAGSQGKKQVSYLSMEFLLGRSLKNSLYNLGVLEPFRQALEGMGVNLENLYEQEPDAGLGNGGLGRLAACYLDALATQELPATGYCILYEYGIFQQKIIDGWQTEQPDLWLPGGEVWLTPRPDESVAVRFGGRIEEFWEEGYHHVIHKDYTTVTAIPYDMYVSGYHSGGVSLLRLWQAKRPGVDMESFNRGDYIGAFGQSSLGEAISKILYPNDSHTEGKLLRLRQQYFLVAASVRDIVKRHMDIYGSLENFAEKNAIHINDTHPTLAIPELMRILLDECGYGWDQAWDVVKNTFAYTNHTVLAEALERWNSDLFQSLLPRIHQIILEINRRLCAELYEQYHLDSPAVAQMAILGDHELRMANLCVAACHSVNGVSGLHSEIIRRDLFRDFAAIQPEKFCNVTNGIASRRWLGQANPLLTDLITDCIGGGFLKDFSRLAEFGRFRDDAQVLERLAEIKRQNKLRLAEYLKRKTGEELNPDSIFDVQVKRLHEYKRQQMNALEILAQYQSLKDDPGQDFTPRTYLFGAKAAPGYYLAKQIIKLLCTLARVIDSDPQVRDKMRVCYLEDYNVTLSEILMPACEISEQISLAGKEASGTGNMKLMLGGAVTLGTLDGANVEIAQAVGLDNILIFGMTAQEVEARKAAGYHPEEIYQQNPIVRRALDALRDGIGGETFPDLYRSLRYDDPYMVLADFDAYRAARRESERLYENRPLFNRMSLANIAASGVFCADRAVGEYAEHIWDLR